MCSIHYVMYTLVYDIDIVELGHRISYCLLDIYNTYSPFVSAIYIYIYIRVGNEITECSYIDVVNEREYHVIHTMT